MYDTCKKFEKKVLIQNHRSCILKKFTKNISQAKRSKFEKTIKVASIR